MYESLNQRVSDLEALLGLNRSESTDEATSLNVEPLKKKLQDLELGFVMQLPVEKLYRLKQSLTDKSTVPLKDKIRSVNFSSGLMEKRVDLLAQVQQSADVVFNSNSYSKAEELTPQLKDASNEMKEAFEVVSRFESEFNDFYAELQTILSDLRTQTNEVERNVQIAEKRKGLVPASPNNS